MASALVVACAGSRGTGSAVGESDKGRGGRSPKDAGGQTDVDGTVALPPAYRSTFVKLNPTRLVSKGHAAGRWEIDVWANELAQRALAERSHEVPPGAIVVQEHYERAESPGAGDVGARGPIMVMEKRPPGYAREHGDWRWVVVGSQGQLVREGVIEQCAGCHDDAPMDGLFPLSE